MVMPKFIRYHTINSENEYNIIWLPVKPTLEFYEMQGSETCIPESFLLNYLSTGSCSEICYYDGILICLNSGECIGCPISYEWKVQVEEAQWKQGAIRIEYPSLMFKEKWEIELLTNILLNFIKEFEVNTVLEGIWDCGTVVLLFSKENLKEKFINLQKKTNEIRSMYFPEFLYYREDLLEMNTNLKWGKQKIKNRSRINSLECIPLILDDHLARIEHLKEEDKLFC